MMSFNSDVFLISFYPGGLSIGESGGIGITPSFELELIQVVSSIPVAHFYMKLGAPGFIAYILRIAMCSL